MSAIPEFNVNRNQHNAPEPISPAVGVIGNHTVQLFTDKTAIRLDKIKSLDIPRRRIDFARKINSIDPNLCAAARATFAVLRRFDGNLNAKALFGMLKTLESKAVSGARAQNITDPDHIARHVLQRCAEALRDVSNRGLAAIYQTFQSPEMALLKEACMVEADANPGNADVKAALFNLFQMEAVVIKEASERMIQVMDLDPNPNVDLDLRVGHRERLSDAASANGRDISPRNLKVLVETAAQSSIALEKNGVRNINAELRDRNIQGIDARQIGDIMRQSELTISVDAQTVLFDENGLLSHPDQSLRNIFHYAEEGLFPKGRDYNEYRDVVEKKSFPEYGTDAPRAAERPVYASLNLGKRLIGPTTNYGACTFVLRPNVAQRATYTSGDTFYDLPLRFTPEGKAAIVELLQPEKLKALIAEAIAESNRSNPYGTLSVECQERKALEMETLLRIVRDTPEGSRFSLQELERRTAAKLYNDEQGYAYKAPTVLTTALLRALGDADARRAVTATYDTLETLLPHMDQIDAACLYRLAQGGDGRPYLGSYVEAQIQGPLKLSRDVAEIRIANAALTPTRTSQLAAFAKEHGIKVTIYGFSSDSSDAAQRDFAKNGIRYLSFDEYYAADSIQAKSDSDAEMKQFLSEHPKHSELRAEVNRLDGNRKNGDWSALKEQLLAIAKTLPGGENLTEAPIDGAALQRVFSRFAALVERRLDRAVKENAPLASSDTLIRDCLTETATKMLTAKVALQNSLKTLEFENEGQRAAFAKWALSASVLDPDELPLYHRYVMMQTEGLQSLLADKDAAPDLKNIVELSKTVAESASYDLIVLHRARGDEFGPDNTYTIRDRLGFLSAALLKATVGAEALERLRVALETPFARTVMGVGHYCEIPGGRELPDHVSLLSTTQLMDSLRKASARELGVPTDDLDRDERLYNMPPTTVSNSVRAFLRDFFPDIVGKLDASAPAREIAPFPAPAPESLAHMPKTVRELRGYLLQLLDHYREHEKTFDPMGVHGMGHAIRAFMYSVVMCNILKERGVKIDWTATLAGIAAHDAGRKANGNDVYEKDSAAIAAQFLDNQAHPGEAYLRGVADAIIHERNADTLEAQVLQAADSMDIGRTGTFDPERNPFLRDSALLTGTGDILRSDQTLRTLLFREAAMFILDTDPKAAIMESVFQIHRRVADAAEPMAEFAKATALVNTAEAVVKGRLDDHPTNESYVQEFEKVIRDNPARYPLMSKYYFSALDSSLN